MTGKQILCCLIGCMLMHTDSIAQTFITRLQYLNVHHGLSDNLITGLVKMDDGNLWISTLDGLNRYDGFTFEEFNTLNSNLNSNVIKCITHIESTLIVLTGISNFELKATGLYLYDIEGGEFVPFTDVYGALPFSLSEVRMCKAVNGSILFALNEGKGWSFDAEQRKWISISAAADPQVSFIYQNRILTYNEEGIQGVEMENENGNVHLPDSGLINIVEEFIPAASRYVHMAHSLELSEYSLRHKLHWIPRTNHLYGVNERDELITFPHGENKLVFERDVKAIEIDDEHDVLYIGTEDGLYVMYFEPTFFEVYFNDKASANRNFSCRGIAVINDTLYANAQDAVYRTPLIIGSDIDPVFRERMLPMHVVGEKDLIFGRKFPIRLKTHSGKLESLADSNLVGQLWSILVHNGYYFLGASDGVMVLDSALLEQGRVSIACENRLKENALYVYDIKSISGDRLCYATSKGLFIGDDECEQRSITFRNGAGRHPTFSQFTHTLQESDSTFWATTLDGGIIHFKLNDTIANVINQINRDHGLPTNTCYGIYSDQASNKWVSTDLGIILLRPDLTFRIYTTDDGLPDNEFNRISHFQDRKGNIYFGGLNGVVAFSPGNIETTHQENLSLDIRSFVQYSGWHDTVLNKTNSVLSTHAVKFRPGDKFFEIRVGLNDLFETSKHTYEYRYANSSEEWSPMRGNALRQNQLPYGKHILEIRGRNANGELARNKISLAVIASRPIYLTWWFYLTLALGGILMLREYLLNKTRRVHNLEEMVRQRTYVIAEQAEALRRSEAARSRFFANISHELRTPLTLIKGPLQRLAKPSGNREALLDQYSGMMLNNAELLHERIDDLLTLSQADAGQLKVEYSHVNLNAFLERLVDSFRGLTDQKLIRIAIQNDMPASMVIRADRKKIEHILINYITNAIKHSDNTSITLRCYAQESQLIFAVNDNGHGIDREEITKIFDRFYQIGKATGVGLGLALSRELSEVMNGSVWATSETGLGSTFYLSIPLQTIQEDPETYEAPSSAFIIPPESYRDQSRSDGEMNAIRILCVEDNPAMRSFLVNEFSHYHIEASANGVEALQWLQNHSKSGSLPDCIVSDIMMPEMDGFEFLKIVKSTDKYSSIPFVMLTARAGEEDKLEALRIGVDDYISKPFSVEELRTRIENLVARKPQKQDPEHSPEGSVVIDNEWLRHVEDIVKNRLDESSLTMDAIAQDVHLSRSQFFRRLKSYTGLTPNNYLREVRLFKARDLLESGKVGSVKELSASVGFQSPSYFSQLFLERFGYRPADKLKP